MPAQSPGLAKAGPGTQFFFANGSEIHWVPACAGMTETNHSWFKSGSKFGTDPCRTTRLVFDDHLSLTASLERIEQIRQTRRSFEDFFAGIATFLVTNDVGVRASKNITLVRQARILVVVPGVFLMLQDRRVVIRGELRVAMIRRRVRIVRRHLAGILKTAEFDTHTPAHAATRLARRAPFNDFSTVNNHARCRVRGQRNTCGRTLMAHLRDGVHERIRRLTLDQRTR